MQARTGTTGGNAEPNDAPYGDMFFRSAGTNPFVDTDEDPLSTFGLDVDTGSYAVARRYLHDGHLPPPEAIRVEEFVNAFHYGDTANADDDFTLRAEAAPLGFADPKHYRLVRFAVTARSIAPAQRKPAVLTFVIDVSGSMDMENRLGW
jgi:Ca-activated chloride channel family protein